MTRRRHTVPFVSDVSMRDEIAQAEVTEILKGLPTDHPSRLLFDRGRPTTEIQHALVGDHPQLVAPLTASINGMGDRVRALTRMPVMWSPDKPKG